MMRFLAVVSLLALSISSTVSQCVNHPDDFSQYQISTCPLAIDAQPHAIEREIFWIPTSLDSGTSPWIPLNFSVNIYGLGHRGFFMKTDGVLTFGSSASTSTTGPIPQPLINGDYQPIMAPFWHDLILTAGVGIVSYGESGTVGNRTMTIRYSRVHPYYSRTAYPNTTLSVDIVFYEARPNDFDFIYYSLNFSSIGISQTTSIGITSWDDGAGYFAFFSATNDWPTVTSTLHRKVASFRYVGATAAQERCGGLGYDLSALRGVPMTTTIGTTNVYFTPCAVDTRCASYLASDKASACQVTSGSVSTDWGVFGPSANRYKYPVNDDGTGLVMMQQTGTYCTGITAQRFLTVTYVCNAADTTPRLTGAVVGGAGTCVLNLTVSTSLVCGPGARGNDTDLMFRPSSMTSCNTVQGSAYSQTLCPSTQRRPIELTSPTFLFSNVASGSTSVALPFRFNFYGKWYTSVWVTLQGALFFGATSTFVPTGKPPGFGSTVPTTFPSIWGYSLSFSNVQYAGIDDPTVSYASQVVDGRNAFVARYSNMRNSLSRGLFDVVTSFDIILFEGEPGGVQVRYYEVSPQPSSTVVVGSHGPDDMNSYTAYAPSQDITPSLARQFTGATLSWNYTGRLLTDACTAFGVNFSNSFTGDITYNDTARGLTYRISPCGPLINPAPCANSTSACQVSRTNAGTVLSTFNPAAITWDRSPDNVLGLRATLRDGTWCAAPTNAPRTLNIDWVCSKIYPTSTLVQIEETSTCVFKAIIYTPVACESPAVCANINTRLYSGSMCPRTVPKIAQTGAVSILAGQDDASVRVRIPVDFYLYGRKFQFVYINSNGVLSFGPTDTSLPQIAPFSTNLVISATSSVSYSTETIDGKLAFVVRFQDVEFFGNTRPDTSDAISFDVVMFGGLSGNVEIRYYIVNQPTAVPVPRVTAGLLNTGSDPEEQVIIHNNVEVDAAIAASFTTSTLKLSYSGPDLSAIPCAGLGYNLTSIAEDIRFTDTASGLVYVAHVCGTVTDNICAADPLTSQSMLCRRTSTVAQASLSIYNPREAYWVYPSSATGVQLVTQSGQACATGTLPYTTVFNFVCSAAATSPVITRVTPIGSCSVQVNISTSLVCGAGDRAVPVAPANSTLAQCTTYTGLLYNAELCPRRGNASFIQPQPLVSATRILDGDDAVTIIPIGFPFYLYDRPEDTVSVNTNGLLTFGFEQTNTSAGAPYPNMGLTLDQQPSIAAFFTDLINVDTTSGIVPYQGYIAYARVGAAPNRQLIIRYHKVDFFATRDLVSEQSASFDVVLTEGEPGGIEVRYYHVDPVAQQNVVIGIHGQNVTYTSVANYIPVTSALAGELSGATLRFRYTGVDQPDFCSGIPSGYNLSAITSQDLAFNSSSHQYFFRACGVVSAPVCTSKYATQRSSLCRATMDGSQTVALAGDSPASVSFSSGGPGSLIAVMQDGMICPSSGAPYRTLVRYTCDPAAMTAFISHIDTAVVCETTLIVNTNQLCTSSVFYGTDPETGTYDAQLFFDPAVTKRPQTNPINIFPLASQADSGKVTITLPFSVWAYGEQFSSLSISANGWLSFRPGTQTGQSTSFPWPVATYGVSMPILALCAADLDISNRFANASVMWSVEGNAPNRYIMVRWDMVNYWTTKNTSTTVSRDYLLTFEAKLHESTNNIEVSYWDMQSYTPLVSMGLQKNGSTMTVVTSGQTIAGRGLLFVGQTLRYVYNRASDMVSSSSTGAAASSTVASSTAPASSSAATASSTAPSTSSSTVASSTAASSSSSTVASSTARSSSSSSTAGSSTAAGSSSAASSTTSPAVSSSAASSTASASSSARSSSSSTGASSSSATAPAVSSSAASSTTTPASSASSTSTASSSTGQSMSSVSSSTASIDLSSSIDASTGEFSSSTGIDDGLNSAVSTSSSILFTVVCAIVVLLAL